MGAQINTSKGGRTASDRQDHKVPTTVFAKQIRAREDAPRPTDRITKGERNWENESHFNNIELKYSPKTIGISIFKPLFRKK